MNLADEESLRFFASLRMTGGEGLRMTGGEGLRMTSQCY